MNKLLIIILITLASCEKPSEEVKQKLMYKEKCYHLEEELLLKPSQIIKLDSGMVKLLTDQGIIYSSGDCLIQAVYI